MKNYSGEEHVNVGVGSDVTIKELAETVMRVVGYQGEIRFNTSKPDGTPRKLMASDRLLAMGWKPKTSLEEGLRQAYDWFLSNQPALKAAS
jgi:GDP-L-fucose synthase